ncbi:uncharacterized protein [Rutidosis leptorrhynchoides]|uniref:uncharacterized protein n=1 Tax=Rutidosis leptorrhynchoides TaxID=125765 RepID=UPI003A990FB4
MALLDDCNPLVKMYRRARDFFEQNNEPNFKIKLIARRSSDERNYNLSTVDEVDALIVGDIDLKFDKRDIIVDSLKEGLQRISDLHPQYLALQYPLLFAHAEDGYRTDIYHCDVDKNTTRLKKHSRHFANLTEANLTGEVVNSMLGNRIKLPASFTGSARYMIENYRDAMALSRVYGYPDLFITFTCNSKWPEIRRALEGTGFNPEHKPAYQARMFKIKLDDIKKKIVCLEGLKLTVQLLIKKVIQFTNVQTTTGRVTAGVCDEVTDEIKKYYDCRYVSSCKAVCRMLSFDIHNRNPTVIRLAFHLSDQHSVIFDKEDLIENVLDSESVNRSQFLEWMNINRVNEDARQLSYLDFPTKFVWNKETKLWSPRKVFTGTIGLKGPTSYEDIRTVNGQLCPTIKDACYEMGLLDDDQEYIDGIKEASSWGGSHFVRNLFCQLLTSESLSRPEVVFDEAFEYLSVDIIRHHLSDIQPTREMMNNLTLNEIEKLLQRNGKSLKNYPSMPYPSSTAYDTIVSAVAADIGGAFFVYGSGGTGKTFLWNTLSAALRSRGQIVLNVASSGIAALLLPGGRTAHSRFEIPIDPKDESYYRIQPNSHLAELIRKTKLIIWDEAPMVNRLCIETLDRSLRDVCRQINSNSMDTPFGGKAIVFGDDFRQVLPVITMGKWEDVVAATLNSSYLWDHVSVLKLTVNMRLTSITSTHPENQNEINVEEIRNFAD